MTVLLPDSSRLPFLVVFMDGDGCVKDKILEITPSKVGSDGQDEGKYARRKGSGGGSSSMLGVAFVGTNVCGVLETEINYSPQP